MKWSPKLLSHTANPFFGLEEHAICTMTYATKVRVCFLMVKTMTPICIQIKGSRHVRKVQFF